MMAGLGTFRHMRLSGRGRWMGRLLVGTLLGCSGAPAPRTQGDGAAARESAGQLISNPRPGSPAGGPPTKAREPQPTELPALLHPARDTPWLGVQLKAVERGGAGVRVEEVFRGSPAAKAGLEPGDVLLALEGQPLSRPQDVHAAVQSHEPGARVSVSFLRGQRERLFPVELGNLPQSEDLARLRFVGLHAPELRNLATVQGDGGFNWQELRGRVVVIEFWARWCGVCRYLVPVMNRWHARYRPQGMTLLGITPDSVTVADRTIVELRMAYAVASDRSGDTLSAYGARELPTVFVVDKHGMVKDVMVGLSEARLTQIENLVQRLLDEE